MMEIMDKGLTMPNLGLIVWPKILQTPQNLFGRSAHKAKIFEILKKTSHWVSVVRHFKDQNDDNVLIFIMP